MAVSFTVLGPVSAIRAGASVPLAGPRMLALLAALLLAPNESVPAERLIEWVWGEQRADHPRARLQNAMSRLRQALGDDVVETTSSGYRARADAGTLDLLAFDQLMTGAAVAERAADTVLAADRLRQAIGLWRLPLLPNVDAPELRRRATTLLTERYLTAHEEHARICLQLGRHAEVVAALGLLVEAHPFREPLVAHLMAALAGAGRRADALVTYATVSRILREELGVLPGAALQSLHATLLRAEAEADGAAESASLPGPIRTSHLPAPPGTLRGRAEESAALERWLTEPDRIVAAVVGPAGVGKTALAVTSAHRCRDTFPDGTLFLDLGGYAADAPVDPGVALGWLLGAHGVAPIPAETSVRAARWRGALAGRRILLVLDNAHDTEQVRPLLPGAASPSRALVTSRNQLRGLVARDGAQRIALDGLPVGAVRQVLSDVTGRPLGQFSTGEAVELAHRCDGLPLPVRVVAERLARGGSTLGELLARLRVPAFLAELSADEGTDTDLRTTLSWSCRALAAETAQGYHRLGRHTDDRWSLRSAAAALRRSPEQARVLLDRLVAVHLVRPDGPRHYVMSAPVRAHARAGCGLPSHAQPNAPLTAVWLASGGAAASPERFDSAAGVPLATVVLPPPSTIGEVDEPR
jgi:DNA-binding SARP family transcriptional activator